MRKLILALVSLPVVALASSDNPTRQELLQTIVHIQSLAQETQKELDAEKAAHADTEKALNAAGAANLDTQTQFNSYQKAAEQEIKKGNDAITQLDSVVKKLHRAKWILCGVWVLLIGFVITQLPLAFKQYELIGGAALMAAGCTFIWVWV